MEKECKINVSAIPTTQDSAAKSPECLSGLHSWRMHASNLVKQNKTGSCDRWTIAINAVEHKKTRPLWNPGHTHVSSTVLKLEKTLFVRRPQHLILHLQIQSYLLILWNSHICNMRTWHTVSGHLTAPSGRLWLLRKWSTIRFEPESHTQTEAFTDSQQKALKQTYTLCLINRVRPDTHCRTAR